MKIYCNRTENSHLVISSTYLDEKFHGNLLEIVVF